MTKFLSIMTLSISLLFPGVLSAETILITGSNRGIGLGLAKGYAEKGWRVIAIARNPSKAEELNELASRYDNLTVDELDVTDDKEISSLAEKYEGTPIDVLINNAGVLGDISKQNSDNIDYNELRFIMDVNVYGPMKLTKAFLPHVLASKQKKILNMTSGLGSLTLTARSGRFYGYRISKAALNMATRAMHADLKKQGVIIGAIAPGQVQTELLWASGFPRNPPPNSRMRSITVDESIAGVMRVVDSINMENVGLPINYDGKPIAW